MDELVQRLQQLEAAVQQADARAADATQRATQAETQVLQMTANMSTASTTSRGVGPASARATEAPLTTRAKTEQLRNIRESVMTRGYSPPVPSRKQRRSL